MSDSNINDKIIEPEIEQAGEITFTPLDDEGAEASPRDTIQKLRERLRIAMEEKHANLLGWQRMKADYANLQKSILAERLEFDTRAKSSFVRDIMPVLDSFDQAMSNEETWNKVDSSWRLGIEYIRNQLLEALANNGVTTFGQVGDKFDPLLHQTIDHETDTNHDSQEVVKKVLQRGVKFKDIVIRPAKVTTTS